LGKSPSLRFGEKTFRFATFKKHPDEELKDIALRAGYKGFWMKRRGRAQKGQME
jgi:hypothetical protein